MNDISSILDEVASELHEAVKNHAPMNSPHEGWAVILEEVDELWDEVKKDRGACQAARKEAIQIAAMAVRYVADLTEKI